MTSCLCEDEVYKLIIINEANVLKKLKEFFADKLIIINEANVLKKLKEFFADTFEYIFFESPIEALKALKSNNDIALIIANVEMKEMDGVSFSDKVSKLCSDTMQILLVNEKNINTLIATLDKKPVFRIINTPWNDYDLKTSINNAIEYYKLHTNFKQYKALEKKRYDNLLQSNNTTENKIQEYTKIINTLVHKQEKSFFQLILVFNKILEIFDPMAATHVKRITIIARELSKQYKLGALEKIQIDIASLLHDIGKLSLPRYLMEKNIADLNKSEKNLLNKTPVEGYKLLYSINKLKKVAAIVRTRRENYDGTGFPDGLAGNNIPIGARIIRVANDYDSLTCRKNLSRQDAINCLKKESGTEYDPDVVNKFIKMLENFDIPTEKEVVVSTDTLLQGYVLSKDIVLVTGEIFLKKDTIIEASHLEDLKQIQNKTPVTGKIFVYKFSLKKRDFNLPDSSGK